MSFLYVKVLTFDIIPHGGYILVRGILEDRHKIMHPSHKDHLGKLNRASGQVDAVKRMIDEGKYCVDIMIQIRAARSALKAVELAVLETHMKSCLDQVRGHSADEQSKKVEEIIALLKKYE